MTTSPGFFFRLNMPPGSAEDGAEPSAAASCVPRGCAGSSERVSISSVKPEVSAESGAGSGAALSITKRAASASSGSSMVMVTSARPSGGRLVVPLNMQSAMRSARSDLWLCSPRTQEMASTTLDLPQPFGPTIQVVPDPLNVTTVRSQNDLKPTISTFRSLSKMSPLSLKSHYTKFDADTNQLVHPGGGNRTRGETTLYSSWGGAFDRRANPVHTKIARKNGWQVLSQRPSRLAQGWRYGKKQ